MRGFMRRSGTLWFLGTWLGLSALPAVVHADDTPDILSSCPDLLAAQRIAAAQGTGRPPRLPEIREEPSDAPIQIESSEVLGGVKEGGTLHLK